MTYAERMARIYETTNRGLDLMMLNYGHDHIRLWDKYWCGFWDSRTATTPAYKVIADWVHATIDYTDGTRWVGRFTRTRLGIVRDTYPPPGYFDSLMKWPEMPELGTWPR